jgi:hypothetical protein
MSGSGIHESQTAMEVRRSDGAWLSPAALG